MIKKICKDSYIDDLAQLYFYTSDSQFIINDDEIILLRNKGKDVIYKYNDHPKKEEFKGKTAVKGSDEIHETISSASKKNILETDKMYLSMESCGGFRFRKTYIFRLNDYLYRYNESVKFHDNAVFGVEQILNREEVERIFNPDNYDSAVLFNRDGKILYAKTVKDGEVISCNIIPTDKELIKRDLRERENNQYMKNLFNVDDVEFGEKIKERSIEEIDRVPIYTPTVFKTEFNHFFVTSKDGEFNVKSFQLYYEGEDKFKLISRDVLVLKPTMQDIIPLLSEEDRIKMFTSTDENNHSDSLAVSLAKKDIEEKLGVSYEMFDSLDVEEQQALIRNYHGKDLEYDTKLRIDGVPVNEPEEDVESEEKTNAEEKEKSLIKRILDRVNY